MIMEWLCYTLHSALFTSVDWGIHIVNDGRRKKDQHAQKTPVENSRCEFEDPNFAIVFQPFPIASYFMQSI